MIGESFWVGAERNSIYSDFKVENPKKALSKLIRADRHLSFYQLLCELKEKSRIDASMSIPSDKELLLSICSHRAELCFIRMINMLGAQVNDSLEGELYPLHIAAQTLWFYATECILGGHEARADLPPHDHPTKFPLAFALNSICDNTCASEWNPKISIFKLIYIFCIPQMKEPLETVKLLASKTEQLEAIGRHFVLRGEIVQLAALLLVAWDKLVKPQGIKGCAIGQLILSELQHYQEKCISQSSDISAEIHEYGANLGNAWKVLEILDIAHDTIDECRAEDVEPHQAPFLVEAKLYEHHNIDLEPDDKYADDVKCLRPQITPKQKAWLFRSIDKKVCSVSALQTPPMKRTHYLDILAPNMNMGRSAGRFVYSHSFHTLAPNLYVMKPVRNQLSQASQKPGTFSGFLRSQGISSSMARLFSTLKRM